MIRAMLLIPIMAVLLSCGLFIPTQADEPTPQEARPAQMPPTVARVSQPAPLPPPTGGASPMGAATSRPLSPFVGDSSIEEKIFHSAVVVKATMTAFSSEVVLSRNNMYRAIFKFNLTAHEYLKGTGPSNIVAIWIDGWSYDTRNEADAKLASDLADRDDQWDDREAIIFLSDIAGGFGPQLDAQFQRAGHFLLGLGASGYHDDRYSLHSDSERYWLPEVSPASTSGDAQEFLLDASSIPQTTTLGYVKQQIRDVTAELAGGDGSDAYRECVLEKYRYIRNQRNFPQVMGRPFTLWNIAQSIVSGQPSGTLLDQREAYGRYPDTKITLWLEGRDSALFSAEDGDSTAFDTDGDGQYDEIKYDEFVKLARPLPAGEYSFDLKESWPSYAPCNHVISNEWTVTATPPVGALHEFFFDPITDGAAVADDDTNGVLKPASFTDSNGASATINRIAWESSSTSSEPAPGSNRGQVGAVKLSVTPRAGLANHIVEFIELDGTLSLSLDPANATVDATTDTLSWAAASQPWEDGDKLMVRIREARPYAPAGLPRLRQ